MLPAGDALATSVGTRSWVVGSLIPTHLVQPALHRTWANHLVPALLEAGVDADRSSLASADRIVRQVTSGIGSIRIGR